MYEYQIMADPYFHVRNVSEHGALSVIKLMFKHRDDLRVQGVGLQRMAGSLLEGENAHSFLVVTLDCIRHFLSRGVPSNWLLSLISLHPTVVSSLCCPPYTGMILPLDTIPLEHTSERIFFLVVVPKGLNARNHRYGFL